MPLIPVMKGFLTYIPGINELILQRGAGGTDSAEYCLGIWLKHLTKLWDNGLKTIPDTIAELGPGATIGVGLAALLSGVNNYYALDVVEYRSPDRNLVIFEKLVTLFRKYAENPTKNYPELNYYLDSEIFPSHILTKELLETTLSPKRIRSIRDGLLNLNSNNEHITINYVSPWNDPHVIHKESVDVLLSHAVLEHVSELKKIYETFFSWLKPKGLMSHQIDLTSHNSSKAWNGHWAYPEWLWKIIVGKRPFLINRQPYSTHIALMKENGFKICYLLKLQRADGIMRSQLAPGWENLSEDDFTCSNIFVISQKI